MALMPSLGGEASVGTVLILRLFSVGSFPLKGRARCSLEDGRLNERKPEL